MSHSTNNSLGASLSGWTSHSAGFASHDPANHGETEEGFDAVEAYFDCITSCSLDDGECITVCTTRLRDHN
jgi:hypothetical protein